MAETTKLEADLRLLIERWPKLAEHIRKKILIIAQGQKEIVSLTWTPKGYEKTVVDTTEDGRAGSRPSRAAIG